MKKVIKFNIIALLLLSSIQGIAQQLPQFTQYMYNTIAINPAYAGSRETFSLVGLHRSQWVGIEGGPTTQTLSVHSPLRNEQVGLGFSLIVDKLGFENFAYAYADFSYTINVGYETKLAFGLKGGLTHYFIDSELLNDPSVVGDDINPADLFFNDLSNRWSPNVGVGAMLHTDRWYVGLSAPRILNTDYNKGRNATIDYVALERVSYYLTGGYVWDISASTKFKPAFMVKATNGAPISYDVTANFLFNEKFC